MTPSSTFFKNCLISDTWCTTFYGDKVAEAGREGDKPDVPHFRQVCLYLREGERERIVYSDRSLRPSLTHHHSLACGDVVWPR